MPLVFAFFSSLSLGVEHYENNIRLSFHHKFLIFFCVLLFQMLLYVFLFFLFTVCDHHLSTINVRVLQAIRPLSKVRLCKFFSFSLSLDPLVLAQIPRFETASDRHWSTFSHSTALTWLLLSSCRIILPFSTFTFLSMRFSLSILLQTLIAIFNTPHICLTLFLCCLTIVN